MTRNSPLCLNILAVMLRLSEKKAGTSQTNRASCSLAHLFRYRYSRLVSTFLNHSRPPTLEIRTSSCALIITLDMLRQRADLLVLFLKLRHLFSSNSSFVMLSFEIYCVTSGCPLCLVSSVNTCTGVKPLVGPLQHAIFSATALLRVSSAHYVI